jgi:hypothetical protein
MNNKSCDCLGRDLAAGGRLMTAIWGCGEKVERHPGLGYIPTEIAKKNGTNRS